MMLEEHMPFPAQKAWVAFSGKTELPWLKILKPGFRHCFVLLNDGKCWITLDPLSNTIELCVHHHVPSEFDLPSWLEEQGLKIAQSSIERRVHPAPCMLFTCVEVIKRILGIHDRFILTPWQLYKHLVKLTKHQNQIIEGDLSWEA